MEGESQFEYDEDVEANDEASETDEGMETDEGWGASEAEDVESDESDGESDESSDEAWQTSEAEALESDESDESDGESDEALDEAVRVSASARLRADQDRNRRAGWARKIAADQRLEARRAASTQRSITSQVRSIQQGVGPAPKVASVGSLQGAGVVTAILPNGRRSRMRIIPTLAPVAEVNRLRSVVMVNERRQASATRRNARAIGALAVAQAAAVRKLSAEQVKSDKELRKRLVEGDNLLDKRLAKALGGGSGVLDKHGKRMMRILRRQRQRTVWNNVLLATSAPFFSAYGERGSPFAKNNLILTGSLLFWLFGDEIVDQFSGKSGVLKGGANLWSYLAFAGNGATSFFLLDKKQHERFVSGVDEIGAAGDITVDLTKSLIAKDSIEDFKKADHTVVATIVTGSAATVMTTNLKDGILKLTVDDAAKVAWIVDTKAVA